MQTLPFQPALRLNRSLTAPIERQVLRHIAQRLPAAITPDHLTILGLAAQVGAGCSYAIAQRHRSALAFAACFIALNWLGDSLDGTVARVRSQQRPRYGFYVDHMVDVCGTTAMMTGLAFSGFVHPAIACAMLIAFLVLSAESYLATYTLGRFEMSQGPFGPTELRILLISGTLWLLRSPYAHFAGHRFLLFDVGGAIATACMGALACFLALRHTAQLFREETLS